MPERALAIRICEILDEKKALDILALDVSKMTVITDYMVLCTGRTAQHARTLCDDVDEKLSQEGAVLRKKEGVTEARWIIMDYGGVLVHIFRQEDRQFYRLERLWEDGLNRVPLPFAQETAGEPFLS